MANYTDVESYSHSDYTGLQQTWMNRVQGPASVTNFAHFGTRNKVLVRAVHVFVRSAASAAGGSLHVMRSTVTIKSLTVASATTAGTYHCFTLSSLNTLHTIGEQMALRVSGACDKGEFDVCYEYQILYPQDSLIGA